jgi:hypothetical protein
MASLALPPGCCSGSATGTFRRRRDYPAQGARPPQQVGHLLHDRLEVEIDGRDGELARRNLGQVKDGVEDRRQGVGTVAGRDSVIAPGRVKGVSSNSSAMPGMPFSGARIS